MFARRRRGTREVCVRKRGERRIMCAKTRELIAPAPLAMRMTKSKNMNRYNTAVYSEIREASRIAANIPEMT
jgi:hypothetical protein